MPAGVGSYTGGGNDVLQAMIEKVRPKLEEWFETTNQLLSRFIKKSSEVEKVSNKLYRIPVQIYPGGIYQKYNADNGAMGAGSAMLIDKLVAGYFFSNYCVSLSDAEMDTTATPDQSTVNVFKKQMSKAMEEIQVYDDIFFHTDGTGAVTDYATGASATSTWTSPTGQASCTTYTFAASTDTIGINKLREGMAVQVWAGMSTTNSDPKIGINVSNTSAYAPASPRVYNTTSGPNPGPRSTTIQGGSSVSGQPLIIHHINYSTKTVYLLGVVASAATGDFLTIPGVGTYGPAVPTTINSAWPTVQASFVSGTGMGWLTGDSFRHGYPYANDANTTDYFLTQSRATYPNGLQPAYVDGAGTALVSQHVLMLLDQLYQKRSPDIIEGLMGVAHNAQRTQYFNSGIAIANWMRTETTKPMLDIMPSNTGYGDTFQIAGVNFMISKRQARDRIDLLNPSKWGRANLYDTRFKNVGGKTIFENRDPTSGQILAGQSFYVIQAYDFVCFDPGGQAYADGLTIPTGY